MAAKASKGQRGEGGGGLPWRIIRKQEGESSRALDKEGRGNFLKSN